MYLFVYTRGKFVPQKTLRWLLLCFAFTNIQKVVFRGFGGLEATF